MEPTNTLPGQRRVSPDQAFALALKQHAEGHRQQAEALAAQVVKAQPRHAPAWQLLGVIAHENGQTRRGIELLGQAISLAPLVAVFYANRGEMHRLTGNREQAIADGEQAVRLDPRLIMAQSNLGIAYYDAGELDKAEACQKAALTIDSGYAPALNNLGSIRRDRKDRPGAIALYRQVLAINPNYVESANNLGALLVESDDPEAAVTVLMELIRTHANYAEAHGNIGNAFMVLENFKKAEMAFNNAIRLKPDYAEAYEGLARCMQEAHNLPLAMQHARKAQELRPGRASTQVLIGALQSEEGYPEKALVAYKTALQLDPKLIAAHMGIGHLQMELGRLDVAEEAFRTAIKLDPEIMAPRMALTQVRKVQAGDPELAALLAAEKDIPSMPETRAISLHFALGKALEDTKEYDRAFTHFLEGCRLKRKRLDYSADNQDLIAENIGKAFSADFIAGLRDGGCPSDMPIFVVGMPRSGTTLTETIIASHPSVYGAGELPDLLHIAGKGNSRSNIGYPLNMAGITRDELTRMGEEYVAGIKARAPTARHVSDKMPANFHAVGLVHLMLPNAKIVHIKRNAVDTCVSAFTKLFNRSQYQSYDLREIGRYYRSYLRIMEHWRAVLPPGSFYELQYEQLVANQEEESRKLIAYCGLEWNDACLTPDKTERNVKTASVTQVRQPVYKTSVERWRVYEKFLGPLLEELGDAAFH